MTALTSRPPASDAATLRALAWIEARRYARHPLFLIGVALLAVVSAATADDRGTWGGNEIGPAFFLGVLGVFVGFGLTRSVQRAGEAVESAPADGVLRTAALCLACLVPVAAALVWLVLQFWAFQVWPATDGWYPAVSSATVLAVLLGGVVAAAGGPLVGVLVGRWTRFPGAGLLTAVALVGWVLLSTFGLGMRPSRWATLVELNAPLAQWASSDLASDDPRWLAAGSPWWHLAYISVLCGAAATAAMLHDAVGGRRTTRLLRVLAVLAVAAAACLGLAVAPDPVRIPL